MDPRITRPEVAVRLILFLVAAFCLSSFSVQSWSDISVPPGGVFTLDQNNPNPFHAWTTITYSIPISSTVTLEIFDITGRSVETLVNEAQQPGIRQVEWDRKDSPSGVFFCKLRACPERSPEFTEGRSGEPVEPQSRRTGELEETRKMILLD